MRRLIIAAAVTAVASAALFTALPSPALTHRPHRDFDRQGHRGGLGLVVESTLPAFANALELGVRTLELDVRITEDGHAAVTHDRRVSGAKCLGTGPAFTGDPEHPYVGKYIKDLTLAQVRTLDCGTQTLPRHPRQEARPGETMPPLGRPSPRHGRVRIRTPKRYP